MTLTIDLQEDDVATLMAKARAQGVSAEQYARHILEGDLKAPVRPRRHISAVIRDNMSSIPTELFAGMPSDGASEHDHYIYGFPKRNLSGDTVDKDG